MEMTTDEKFAKLESLQRKYEQCREAIRIIEDSESEEMEPSVYYIEVRRPFYEEAAEIRFMSKEIYSLLKTYEHVFKSEIEAMLK